MTAAQRAFIGAILGAAIALLFHPLSRPWLQYGFWRFGPSPTVESSPWLAATLDELPEPTTEEDVSLWTQIAAQKVHNGEGLSRDDLLLVAELVRMASEQDNRNAYWRQCEAVFQQFLSNDQAAILAWNRASNRPYWNDYQPERVKKFLDRMEFESGATMAWHSAVAHNLISSDCPRLIYEYGINTIGPQATMDQRWTTFQNGRALRDGARSRNASEFGHALVEVAAAGASASGRQRDITTNRMNFALDLAKKHQDTRAQIALRTLKENEAYTAMVFGIDAKSEFRRRSAAAALAAALPGSLIFTAGICGLLYIAFRLLRPVNFRLNIPLAVPLVLGFLLGLIAYHFSGNVLASLWVLLVVGLFAVRPAVSLQTPANLHPLAWIGAAGFGALFAALGCAVSVAGSTPFRIVASEFPSGWWHHPLLALGYGLAGIAGMFILYAQTVAYRTRRPGGKTCLRLAEGAFLVGALGCLFCAVVVTPFCIMWDRQLSEELRMVALNETGYYLSR